MREGNALDDIATFRVPLGHLAISLYDDESVMKCHILVAEAWNER